MYKGVGEWEGVGGGRWGVGGGWEAEGGLHLPLGHQWCCVFSKGQIQAQSTG